MNKPESTHWNDDRLDRLAAAVEANSRDIAALTEAVADNTASIEQQRENIAQLASIAQIQQQTLNQSVEILVQEIRGLRTENRRILDHLFGQQEGNGQ